ncbi:MAG: hypothetical protein ACOX4V_11595 [Anaerovoracaceae bacterium]|jgi:uncharacterized membrane protein YccC|nr:hypothetical protein [Clostridiales bacterium]
MKSKHIIVLRLSGVVLAIIGAVIIIHTVPIYIWYIILVALLLAVAYLVLSGSKF